MAVFIELTTDAFEDNFERRKGEAQKTGRAGASRVRRPLRGIEVREDTYAVLKVIRADGTEIKLFDAGAEDGTGQTTQYTNFMLQSVVEARVEKHQIVETFGEAYIFFFGEAPRFLDITAKLLMSHDFNWVAEWWANYEQYLRGTKCVEQGARCFLFYDDNIVEGYIIQCQAQSTESQPHLVDLVLRFYVTRYSNISFVGDPNFPIRSSVELPFYIDLTQGDAWGQIVSYLQGEAATSAALNSLYQTENTIASILQQGGSPGAARRISDALRSAPRTVAFTRENLAAFDEVEQGERYIRSFPLRSKISDNIDEYTGSRTGKVFGIGELPAGQANQARTIFESVDLFKDSFRFLSCYGANNLDNPLTVNLLGLAADTGLRGIEAGLRGIGASRAANRTASFRPKAVDAFGFGQQGNGRNINNLNDLEDLVSDTQRAFGNAKEDPFGSLSGLVNVQTGSSARTTNSALAGRNGYSSQYGGPGFGQSGFGDFGGFQYGTGFGTSGDPGYLPASRLTFAGQPDTRSAFERFLNTNSSRRSGFGEGFGGVSVGDSFLGEISAGASISVGGKASAFSLVSVGGTLDPTAQARLQRQQTKFGFASDNPFGVECADPPLSFTYPSPGEGSVSAGKSFTFP